MKHKSLSCFLSLQLLYPLCVLIGYLTGQEFLYTHDILCLAAVTCAALWLTHQTRRFDTPTFWAVPALILSLVHAITILLNIFHWSAGIAAVVLIVCGWLVFDLTPRGFFRGLCHVLILLLTLVLLLVIPFWFFFGSIGSTRTCRTLDSPDGRYRAQVVSIDQGALGGSTVVDVLDRKKTVNLLLGSFVCSHRVYEGGWGEWETMELLWTGKDVLSINGTDCPVENENSLLLNGVADALDISISSGRILEHWDTHGGFHGDSRTFAELQGQVQIPESKYWHQLPLTENLSAAIYGGPERSSFFQDETGSPILPPVENGCYYFCDRHPNTLDPASDASLYQRGSYNFTLAVYDEDTKILYYFELDT